LLDMPGLAILRPTRADAASSPTNCVVGGGNFSHLTCVCWDAPHAPAIQYRGQHLFLFEHAMPKPGLSAAHQRTLRMTRAQHRLRSRTAAERGWLRTRLTLRTVPFCVLGLSAHKARRPIGVLARRQRRRPMAGVRCAPSQKMSPSLERISIAKRSPCRFFHVHTHNTALSFLSQSVREFRRGVRAQHEVHASYDGIRFDSITPMFRVPLPPRPTARLPPPTSPAA
jgi:hypothetical protein